MIAKLADKVAVFCVRNSFISQEDKALYQLGIDVAVSTAIQTMVILLAGILVHNVVGSILFLVVMQSVRSNSGGYHARTRIGCLSAMVVAYLISRYIPVCIIRYNMEIEFIVLCVLYSNLVFFLWAPIKNDRKILKEGWRTVARKRAIAYLELWTIIAIGIYFVRKFLSVQIMTILLIISYLITISRIGRRKHNEEI